MTPIEVKTECTARFQLESDYTESSEYFPSIIQLYQARHDETLTFCYGFVEVGCSFEFATDLLNKVSQHDLLICVCLPDNQLLECKYISYDVSRMDLGHHVSFSFVSINTLKRLFLPAREQSS